MNRLIASFALVALVGCGQALQLDPTEQAKDPNSAAVSYPKGPYGYGMGSIVADLSLTGQADDNNDGVVDQNDATKTIHLSDYYMNKQYQVLVVMVAAGWCAPCKLEQPELVKLWNSYGGKTGKVAFLEAIIEDAAQKPADVAFVDQWSSKYKLPFDMAADPTVVLGPYYPTPAFPMQMVIRTKDMSITWQNNGLATDLLKAQIDSDLN